MAALILLCVSFSRQNSVNEPAPEFSEAIPPNHSPALAPEQNVSHDIRRRQKRKRQSENSLDLDESPDVRTKRLKLAEAISERLRKECSTEILERISQEDLEAIVEPSVETLDQDMSSEEETDDLDTDLSELALTHYDPGSSDQGISPNDDLPTNDDPDPEHFTLRTSINARLIRLGDYRLLNDHSNFAMTLIDDYRSLAARSEHPEDNAYEIIANDIYKYLIMFNDLIFLNV